jgi:Na+-translocating ferredoxin:NAD+ oxidoreductase RnfD subunit
MIAETRYTAGHLAALRRFACAISILTIVGHGFLGFELSYAQPLVALATAYSMQFILELFDAVLTRRQPRFRGGGVPVIDFFLSAHITALALAMLLYYNSRLWDIAFATSVAIASKYVFRAPYGAGTRHVFNPSNLAITVTLLSFPWIGLAPPWQFTTELDGVWDWALPAVFLVLGTYLNAVYTRRIPLILAWLASFVFQALVRYLFFDGLITAMLAPVSGVAALLFTFYMAPDPATTPNGVRGQIVFGASIGILYGIMVILHVVFGLYIALTIVCAARGAGLYLMKIFGAGKFATTDASIAVPVVASRPA